MGELSSVTGPETIGPAGSSGSSDRGPGRDDGVTLVVPAGALRLGLGLGLIVLFLVAAAAQFADGLPEADWAFGIIAITSLDYRGNIANWGLTGLLVACALQLAWLGALRRRNQPRAAMGCSLLAGLLLLASLVGFADFVERFDLWLPVIELVDGLLFWSVLLALTLLLPRLLGESFRSRAWMTLAVVAAALCALSLLLGSETVQREALRLWYDSGGGESGADKATGLLELGRMMLRLTLAATVSLVLLDKLAAAGGGLRIDVSRRS